MPQPASHEMFDRIPTEDYDRFNDNLRPISDNLHFLTRLVLHKLPTHAHVLCVGVGTGADILAMARHQPHWTFTGIDPSVAMLKACESRLREQGLLSRCNLFHGRLSDFESDLRFDVITCLFVMHFVADEAERASMFARMHSYLKSGGFLINAEISNDFAADSSESLVENWKTMQVFAGTPAERAHSIPDTLKNVLSVLTPEKTAAMIEQGGFGKAIQFFQSFLIRAWYSQKT